MTHVALSDAKPPGPKLSSPRWRALEAAQSRHARNERIARAVALATGNLSTYLRRLPLPSHAALVALAAALDAERRNPRLRQTRQARLTDMMLAVEAQAMRAAKPELMRYQIVKRLGDLRHVSEGKVNQALRKHHVSLLRPRKKAK